MERPTDPTGTLTALKSSVSVAPKAEDSTPSLTEESVLDFPKTLSLTECQVIDSVLGWLELIEHDVWPLSLPTTAPVNVKEPLDLFALEAEAAAGRLGETKPAAIRPMKERVAVLRTALLLESACHRTCNASASTLITPPFWPPTP
jgi:hypothetical protein